MRSIKIAVCALGLSLGSFLPAANAQTVPWSGPITNIDGRQGPQFTAIGTPDVRVRRRPMAATEKSLVLENLYIHDVSNQKAIDIGATLLPTGSYWAYKDITVRNYDGARVNRDESRFPGLHIDFLRVAGGGNWQDNPTNVTLENIYIHDGDAMPILIQDGAYGTITLRNVRLERTTLQQVQLSTQHTGRIDRVIIENSPGLRVALMGRPGTIGQVVLRNSPGASVADLTINGMRSGSRIVMDSSPSSTKITPISTPPAVPEPAGLGILALGGTLLARRRAA